MKKVFKKLAVVLMCATLVAAAGCGDKPVSSTATASTEEPKKEETTSVSTETSVSESVTTETSASVSEEVKGTEEPEGPNGAADDDFTGYIELLTQYFYALMGPTDTYGDYEEPGYSWLADFRYVVDATGKSPLELVGFSAHDYSGDGKLDLIIAGFPVSEWDRGTDIKAIYTTDENGEYHLTLEGWGRNLQYMLDDGTFFNEGSSGASENCFGTYKLSNDGKEIEWIDFYFSTYNEATQNVEFYHNTTGVWDKDASEKADVKDEIAFGELQESYESRVIDIDLKPLYSLQGAIGIQAGCLLYPSLASDYQYDASSLRDFDVSTDDNPVDLVLEAFDNVYGVTLCTIEWGDKGEQDYKLIPTLEIGDIAYGNAVLVKASFPGDMSTLYYKLKDASGTEHCYYVGFSGFDGSLDMGELY